MSNLWFVLTLCINYILSNLIRISVTRDVTAQPAHTSCRPMMALMSSTSETCMRALGTCESSCIGRPARLFYVWDPWPRTRSNTRAHPVGRTDPEPQDTWCTGALPIGLEPRYMWRRQSPSYQGAGSGATGHVPAPEPTLAQRQDPVQQGTWRRMGECPAHCLDLKLVCRGAQSVGCNTSYYSSPNQSLITIISGLVMHDATRLINLESSKRYFWFNLNLNHRIWTNRCLVWMSTLYPSVGLDTRCN
jgi:hypothetical protein